MIFNRQSMLISWLLLWTWQSQLLVPCVEQVLKDNSSNFPHQQRPFAAAYSCKWLTINSTMTNLFFFFSPHYFFSYNQQVFNTKFQVQMHIFIWSKQWLKRAEKGCNESKKILFKRNSPLSVDITHKVHPSSNHPTAQKLWFQSYFNIPILWCYTCTKFIKFLPEMKLCDQQKFMIHVLFIRWSSQMKITVMIFET